MAISAMRPSSSYRANRRDLVRHMKTFSKSMVDGEEVLVPRHKSRLREWRRSQAAMLRTKLQNPPDAEEMERLLGPRWTGIRRD